MNHVVLSAGLTSLTTFLLGTLAILTSPRGRLHLLLACYSWSIALWSLCFTQLPGIPAPWDIWYGRLLHLGCLFIPVLFFHFALALAGADKQAKGAIFVAYTVAVMYNVLNLFSRLFTAEIVHRSGYAYPRPVGLLYFSYFMFFTFLVTYGLTAMRRALRHVGGGQKRGLRLFFVMTLLGYLGGLNNFLIMIDVQLSPLFPYGLYLVALYGTVAMYVLKRYDLLGIRPRPSVTGKPEVPVASARSRCEEPLHVEAPIAR